MASQSAANSTSSSGEVAGDSAVTKMTSSNTGDSCTWYAGESCSQPRTGYDCLNVPLSTDECAIDPNGACVSMSVYEDYLADKEYYESVQRYFPASTYTYCSARDSVCSTCIAEWTSNYNTTGNAGNKLYCTGSDGCVCVAATEVADWEKTVIASQCDGSDSSQKFSSATEIYIVLAVCVGTIVGVSIFIMRRYNRLAGSSGPGSKPPSATQLRLTGWKSLREKLIESEQSFARGNPNGNACRSEVLTEANAFSTRS